MPNQREAARLQPQQSVTEPATRVNGSTPAARRRKRCWCSSLQRHTRGWDVIYTQIWAETARIVARRILRALGEKL